MNRTAEDFDHAHDLRKHDPMPSDVRMPMAHRIIVAKLVGALEGVASSGVCPADVELDLRMIVADALALFDMPSKEEIHRGVQ